MQADQGINAGHNIVYHNSDTAMKVRVEPGNRKRFYYIEESEK